MPNVELREASPHELRDLLRISLVGAGQTPAELEAQVNHFVRYLRDMPHHRTRHWWAVINGASRCACSCVRSPGRTGLLFLPAGPFAGLDVSTLSAFIAAVVEAESGADIALVQCLTSPDDHILPAALRQAGFREIALLQYMQAVLTMENVQNCLVAAGRNGGGERQMTTFDCVSEKDFAQLISATYAGSLDCPGLSELREIGDVIEGHKSVGRFQPGLWLIAGDTSGLTGCILINQGPLRECAEIVYTGVRADRRNRGLGRALLAEGLRRAQQDEIQRITLAVDERNEPAHSLYLSAGFTTTMRRRAFVLPIDTSHECTKA